MFFLPGISKTGQDLVEAAYRYIEKDYPALMRRAVVVSVPLPKALHWLDDRCSGGQLHGYAMCLNHWLRFLGIPVILINAEWLNDCDRLHQRYKYDAATNYHPECGCPVRYIVAHEIAHFVYVRMDREKQDEWKRSFEPGKPSGYSRTPEEGFCEAFAGHIAGLQGAHFKQAETLAEPYHLRQA